MEKFSEEQILKAIESTGFIYEQKVAAAIERLGFHVETNLTFPDDLENKAREIDVVSHKEVFSIEKFNVKGVCYLFCECKESSNPFVFFTRKKYWADTLFRPQEIELIYQNYFNKIGSETNILDAFYYMQLDKEYFYTKEEEKAVQFCKIVRNGSKIDAQTSGLTDSLIYPLAKAYRYFSGNTPKNHEVKKYCKFFFNLIVVKSQLYTVYTDQENPELRKVNYVPFVRDIQSGKTTGSHLITFVNYDYLKEFINKVIFPFCMIVHDKYISDDKYLQGPTLKDILPRLEVAKLCLSLKMYSRKVGAKAQQLKM